MKPAPLRILLVASVVIAAFLPFACGKQEPATGTPAGIPVPRAQRQDSGGEFSVLTYNVAGLPDPISRSSPSRNTAQIGKLLNAYDLVLVQEDFWYHEELVAQLNHGYKSRPMAVHDRMVNDGLALFSVFAVKPLVRQTWNACNGLLISGNDCLGAKGFATTRMMLGEEAHVDLYNLHADAGRGTGDVLARRRQFEQLRNHIHDSSPTGALIVGGDFNIEGYDLGDEPVFQELLASTGLTDACRHLACKEERLDRVLFRGGDEVDLEPVLWTTGAEFVDDRGTDLSDHKPVNVVFRWSAGQ